MKLDRAHEIKVYMKECLNSKDAHPSIHKLFSKQSPMWESEVLNLSSIIV